MKNPTSAHQQLVSSRTQSPTEMDEEEGYPLPLEHPRAPVTHRIQHIAERNRQSLKQESAVATALANRAYHLPGNGYCADLSQYLINNHHLWGLCCRHPQHPIGLRMRAMNLLGSALFGLAITNLIWLGYIYFNQEPDSVLFQISFGKEHLEKTYLLANSTNDTTWSNATESDEGPSFELVLPHLISESAEERLENSLQITKGMILLWTLGGCLHALYDSAVWYMAACACCLPGNRCEQLGFMRMRRGYLITFLVILAAATASFAVVMRVTFTDDTDQDDTVDPLLGANIGHLVGKYEFILSYFVEFFLTLFVYYPLFQILLFSGALSCLGCDQVRILGGRPFEMKQLRRQQR